KILEHLGYPVFYSDDVAKEIYADSAIQQRVCLAVGNIDFKSKNWKSQLAEIIFSDPTKKHALETIIHGEVALRFTTWKLSQKKSVLFKESALIETFKPENTNQLWIVEAPIEVRFKRVEKRSNLSREEFSQRDSFQSDSNEHFKGQSIRFTNDGIEALLPQIEKALNNLRD
ncbi:MAG: dephospho-CoA kinase, partial [Bacteroidota bacterium]